MNESSPGGPAVSSERHSSVSQFVSLDRIRIDERLQGRLEGSDPEHVRELVEHSNPEGWLPIKLAQLGGENYLVGGFFRFCNHRFWHSLAMRPIAGNKVFSKTYGPESRRRPH